jgi:hypothetical protein
MRTLVILILLAVVAGLAVNALPAGATFPGYNGKIAFRGDWGGNGDIWVMNPDGSGLTQLTTDPGADGMPAWSPDGTKIAFVSARSGSPDIWLMNADGSGQTQLTTNAAAEGNPTWSPDGSKIAYESHRGPTDVYVINVNGTGETNLTNDPSGNDWDPDWCADGQKIVFTSDREDPFPGLYVMNANGSGQTWLTLAREGSCSPDSSKIAYVLGAIMGPGDEIWVMNRDGSGQTQLTVPPGLSDDVLPAWSPDGSKIAFQRGAQIYVMNADGSAQTAVTTPGFSTNPAWQPLPYPRAGSEHMWVTLTFDDIYLDRDSPHDCAAETHVPGPIVFEGDGLFHRSDPYLNEEGKWTVDTEILSMNLYGKVMGYDVTLRAGAGSGDPVLNESIGKIQEQTADSGGFPADSFFDVFFEVTTEDPTLDVMRNCEDVAVRFEGVTNAIPAENVAYTVSGDTISSCGEWDCVTAGPLGGGPAPMSPGWHSTGGIGDTPSGEGEGLVVGGIAEWPDTAAPDSSMGSSSDSAFNYTVLGGALAATAAALGLAAGAWLFVRRRWLT